MLEELSTAFPPTTIPPRRYISLCHEPNFCIFIALEEHFANLDFGLMATACTKANTSVDTMGIIIVSTGTNRFFV